MKKRIVSICFTLVLFVSLIASTWVEVEASGSMQMLDGSYLTHESESTGEAVLTTRGVDLQTGYSKLVKIGPGRIYAGGVTIAQHTVESVQVQVIVERTTGDEDDGWFVVTTWNAENNNADSVNTSRLIEVEGGYFYRVVCYHSAGNDISDSYTNGIFVEEP